MEISTVESPESYRQPPGESNRIKQQLNSFMKQRSTIFLQVVIVLIGILALAIMIRFPLTEGRAANLDLFSIYSDPFILYAYAASIPFFIALYKAFKLLGYIGQNKAFSLNSARALDRKSTRLNSVT